MKLAERWRKKSCGGFWRAYSAKDEELRDSITELPGVWEKLERRDSFRQRPHRSRFSFSEDPPHGLGLFIRAGAVDGDAAEVLGYFHQPLVVVIPLGRDLVNHHHALEGKSKLHKTGLT